MPEDAASEATGARVTSRTAHERTRHRRMRGDARVRPRVPSRRAISTADAATGFLPAISGTIRLMNRPRRRPLPPSRDASAGVRLQLRGGADQILAGHPWIFRDESVRRLGRLPAGTTIAVHDAKTGRFLAAGLFEPEGAIAVRVFSRDPRESWGARLIGHRLDAAIAMRERWILRAQSDAYRLVNGESDGLPALVVDRFGEWSFVQPYASYWDPWTELIADRLMPFTPRGVILRSRVAGASAKPRVIAGELPPPDLAVRQEGARYLAFTQDGKKPGIYLDHRENRPAVAARLIGARILNAYSYTGSFTVAAAMAGARASVNVDLSPWCHDVARRNLELNGLPLEPHEFLARDVLEYLASLRGETFDAIVLDPPSFSTSRRGTQSSQKDTPKHVASALAALAPSGLLIACTNDSRFALEDYLGSIGRGAALAGRTLRVLEIRGLPGDFPTLPAFSEGRYLKLVVAVAD